MPEPKTFIQNVRFKLIFYIIGAVVVYFVTKNMGFPPPFVFMYVMFVTIAFLFYVFIDLPGWKPLTALGANIKLLATFAIFSIVYMTAGKLHPQFDPAFEIAKINKPPLKMDEAAGPEAIAAGKDVFSENKCYNCHKAAGEGSSDRGPDLDRIQLGLAPSKEILLDVIDPRVRQSFGFTDDKSKKEMPTYYGEDITGGERKALMAFLQSLWNEKEMPVRGKAGAEVRWDEDPEMIALGKKTYNGELYEDLNCSVCHGPDGIPVMDGAAEFKNPSYKSKNHGGKPLKDWTDADWYHSVSKGVEDTPMAAWGEEYPPRAIWLAIAYAKQFSKK